MPLAARFEQRIELMTAEGMALGRALHFDEGTAVVHDHVHVGLGLASPRRSPDPARARRARCPTETAAICPCRGLAPIRRAALSAAVAGLGERDIAAGDGGGAGAAVGLQHIAVDA